MDAALERLIDKDDEPESFNPFTGDWEAEQRRWILCDETHIDLFVLWNNMAGMGGESIASLWRMVDEPGSAALFKDFATLSSRKRRLEQRLEFRKKANAKPNAKPAKPPTRK